MANCVARELPSETWPVEISMWNGRKKNNKAWEGKRFVFQ
jgi:hypothetical protein